MTAADDKLEPGQTPETADSTGSLSWLAGRRVEISPRYSRFVGMMKLFLPAMAAALILAVVAWPGAFEQRAGFRLSFSQFATEDGRSLTMVRPRYVGMDANDRPFMVTAETATQSPEDQRLVRLEAPRAQTTREDGVELQLSAAAGLYDQGRQTLKLEGPVDITSSHGYEFHARSLNVDLGAGTAQSDEPVNGQGPFGTIRADHLSVTERGQRLYFQGDVKTVLHPQQTG